MEKVQLNRNEQSLLLISASELLPLLSANSDYMSVKQSAFDWYDKASGKAFQVQVSVTRDESDFIEAFTTETVVAFTTETVVAFK